MQGTILTKLRLQLPPPGAQGFVRPHIFPIFADRHAGTKPTVGARMLLKKADERQTQNKIARPVLGMSRVRWWPLAALLLTQAAVSPPSAPSTLLQGYEPPSHGYVIGLTEGSSACSSGECGEEVGTKNSPGYSYQPIDTRTTAGVSAAGRFTTRICYDVRQVLIIAAQIPNADGSWRTCEELAALGATHPAAGPERSGSDGDTAAVRQRRWFEKNMAAQIREMLRSKRASIYIVAAAPNRENGPAKGPVLLRWARARGAALTCLPARCSAGQRRHAAAAPARLRWSPGAR
jgi:hypothetical protein